VSTSSSILYVSIDIVIEKRRERTIVRFPRVHLSSCLFSIIILGEYSGDVAAAAATAVGKNRFAWITRCSFNNSPLPILHGSRWYRSLEVFVLLRWSMFVASRLDIDRCIITSIVCNRAWVSNYFVDSTPIWTYPRACATLLNTVVFFCFSRHHRHQSPSHRIDIDRTLKYVAYARTHTTSERSEPSLNLILFWDCRAIRSNLCSLLLRFCFFKTFECQFLLLVFSTRFIQHFK